ncbi:hypothetical protein NQZ79_g4272 [Umbelopsis isabellina]|nr:hypothetical protein NQZ79_g4272 [Umbelopsis isabellina]
MPGQGFISMAIPLLPFDHKVGGHVSIFRVCSGVICKESSPREIQMYSQMEPALKPFTPNYYGTINVTYNQYNMPHIDFDNNQHVISDMSSKSKLQELLLHQVIDSQALTGRRFQQEQTWGQNAHLPSPPTAHEDSPLASSPELSCDDGEEEDDDEDVHDFTMSSGTSSTPPYQDPVSGWSSAPTAPTPSIVPPTLKTTASHQQHYVVIQDLTEGLKRPCILDLKMGTRQYGVDCTKTKMLSQTRKCQTSTSALLGMFKPHTGEFKFENKYAGRKLTAQSFEQHFMDFLHDGNQVLIHHVSMLQRKLKLLLHSIMQLPAYRFFGSSLLVIYDGDSLADSEIDIRMIDFAHTVLDEEMHSGLKDMTYPPSDPDQPDQGYILGLHTLLDILNRMQELYHA